MVYKGHLVSTSPGSPQHGGLSHVRQRAGVRDLGSCMGGQRAQPLGATYVRGSRNARTGRGAESRLGHGGGFYELFTKS